MSAAGRWNPGTQSWINDASTSRCIDAGNPGHELGDEPASADNTRINMGAYGSTGQASMSPPDWSLVSDVNNDGITDLSDIEETALVWLTSGEDLSCDLNRDGVVNLEDMVLLSLDYLQQTSWY